MAVIDLFSDTRTKPTPAMRRAIAEAEVGDEQAYQDPEVNALCAESAQLLGKEAAVFLPSGTMANQISFSIHCRPGEALLLDKTAHPIWFEGGGPAAVAGIMLQGLDGRHGIFEAAHVEAAVHRGHRNTPRTACVSVEQTTNMGGGRVWPLETIQAVGEVAHANGLKLHMDGARLMNAVVASDVPAREYCAPFDSVWLDFTKGLGAPVGAVLAGSAAFIDEAWRWKQMLGGAMRQAGIIAAACRHALRHHVERLAEDHAHARRLAQGLAQIQGIVIDPLAVETNLVFFELDHGQLDPAAFIAALAAHDVVMGAMYGRIRAVTHLDVDRAGIDRTLEVVAEVLRD